MKFGEMDSLRLCGAVVAWFPGFGDALKGVFKGGKKVLGSADEISSVANKVVDDIPDGSFSIFDWSGYPDGIPKPEGTFRLLEGAEYDAARKAANNSNSALHKADPSLKGKQVHEIKPVKFDGSPTDQANKIPLTREEHTPLTNWWNDLMRWFNK